MQMTPSLDFIPPKPKELWAFASMLQKSWRNLASLVVNGHIGFGDGTNHDNVDGVWANVVAPVAPNTDFTITHNLGRVPVGYWVMQKDRAVDVYTGSVAATSSQITLRATVASAVLRLFIIGLLFALLGVKAQAQTTVNLTVQDTSSTLWNGPWNVNILPPSGIVPPPVPVLVFGGGSLAAQSGTLSSGTASISLPANANIAPAGTHWLFNVCFSSTGPCFTQLVIVSLSSPMTLTITPPSPTPVSGGGGGSSLAWQNQGVALGTPTTVNCLTNLTCSFSSGTVTIVASSSASTAWSAITGSATNTNTGFTLAPVATGTVPWTHTCPSGITVDCYDWFLNITKEVWIDSSGIMHFAQPIVGSAASLTSFPTFNQNTTGSAASLSSTLACGVFPALTGDTTTSAGSCATSVVKVNGLAVPTSKTILGSNSSGQFIDASSSTLANNTTGTAANLSGTPALPNGTTGTTQSVSDNTTKLATDAFVLANSLVNPMTTIGDMIGGGASGVATRIPGGLTGQVPTATNGSTPAFVSPGVKGADVNAATYTVQCDSATTLVDRATTLRFITTTPIVTIPDPTTSGCGGNFPVTLIASGVTATVNRTTTAVFNIYNGSTVTTGATTFNLTTGQYATLTSPDNANWLVRVVSGGGSSTPCTTTALSVQYNNAGAFGCTSNLTWTAATGVFNFAQLANGNDLIYANRFTDTSPTGTFLHFQNAAKNSDIYNFDVNGNGKFLTSVQTTNSAPACTVGSAGFWCATEGTAFTNVASTGGIYPDSTAHEFMAVTNGASTATPGMMVRRQPSPINQTAQTAAITTATLCAAAAGACNVAGQYHVHINIWGSGTVCGTPSPGGVTPSLTWTDENGVSHAAVVIPMESQTGATTVAVNVTAPTVAFQSALANEGGSGDFTISTNGTVIQYAVAYTACGAGTGTYNLRASVTRLQ